MSDLPEMTEVKSSNIHSIGKRDGYLYVKYHSGQTWRYRDAEHHHALMIAAPNVGKYFHATVKPLGGERVG